MKGYIDEGVGNHWCLLSFVQSCRLTSGNLRPLSGRRQIVFTQHYSCSQYQDDFTLSLQFIARALEQYEQQSEQTVSSVIYIAVKAQQLQCAVARLTFIKNLSGSVSLNAQPLRLKVFSVLISNSQVTQKNSSVLFSIFLLPTFLSFPSLGQIIDHRLIFARMRLLKQYIILRIPVPFQ